MPKELIFKDIAAREDAARAKLQNRLDELKTVGKFEWDNSQLDKVKVGGTYIAPINSRQREAVAIGKQLTSADAVAAVLDALAAAPVKVTLGQLLIGAAVNPVNVLSAGGKPTDVVKAAQDAHDALSAAAVAAFSRGSGGTKSQQKPPALLDQLFIAVRADDDDTTDTVHGSGSLFSSQGKRKEVAELTGDDKLVVAVYGILLRDNRTETDASSKFSQSLALARSEYRDNQELFDAALVFLADEGGAGNLPRKVNAADWAAVVRALVDDGVTADDHNLKLKVQIALGVSTGADDRGPASSIEIDLPDLEAAADIEIVEANLLAMQAIYFSATLEDVRLFEVMDKLVELFNQGILPVGRGKGGQLLFQYWKNSIERFTEVERRNLYARSFGWPGGEAAQSAPNREFNDLWLRFVAAVSSFARQSSLEYLLIKSMPNGVSQEQVRKAGRDLAANLSLYGYGMAYFAATELQKQIKDVITVLSDPDVKGSYGARDMWQVIDQVATLELGGARNSIRYRTMAQSGAVIIRWLANNATRLTGIGGLKLLDEASIQLESSSRRPTVDPTDRDLVDACEQWLAVTGTQDTRIAEFAQPIEGPNQTSRPIQFPAIARDLLDSDTLDSVGLSHNGYHRAMN